MRILTLAVVLLLAWWIGASGLFTMNDATEIIQDAREKTEETQ